MTTNFIRKIGSKISIPTSSTFTRPTVILKRIRISQRQRVR